MVRVMVKKSLIIGFVIVILLVGGYYFSEKQEPETKYTGSVEKVSIGISATSLLPSLVHIAKEKGYFLEYGVDVEVVGYPTGKSALKAMFDDEVEISTVADVPIVSSSFERKDFSVFATILESAQHAKALVRKGEGINLPKDLIGKKIATTIGTTAHFSLATFFTVNGMSLEDVEVVDLKPKEMVDAIVNEEVDAIFAWEPNIYNAQKALGVRALLLPSDVGYNSTFNLVSKNDFINNNPELLKRVLKALVKAEEFSKNNREESVNIVATYLKTDREKIGGLWDGYNFGVSLSQFFLVTLEDQARWKIENDKSLAGKKIPNYLDYIYIDSLEKVKPEAVEIIR